MNERLSRYIAQVVREFTTIPDRRKRELQMLARFVQSRRDTQRAAQLTFICTHNSRRSHLAQIWATTAARHFGITQVEAYSGGTEATAFEPRAVAAVERAGFEVEDPGGENPHYRLRDGSQEPAQICFSKRYDHPTNPTRDFAAVMTCSQADEACPHVAGAALRQALPYDDPKQADGTPIEATTYDERCRQIAREMLFVFGTVAGPARQPPR